VKLKIPKQEGSETLWIVVNSHLLALEVKSYRASSRSLPLNDAYCAIRDERLSHVRDAYSQLAARAGLLEEGTR